MCMGGPGCGGHKSSSSKSNSYTPKKFSASKMAKAPSLKGGAKGFNGSGFGQPKVKFSFGSRNR